MNNNLQCISSEEVGNDWKSWNQLQNRFNIMVYDYQKKYPKSLITEAWKEFCEEAKELHIDINFYKYFTVICDDDIWQVNFYDNPNAEGKCFSVYEIYFDSKRRKILQSRFGIG